MVAIDNPYSLVDLVDSRTSTLVLLLQLFLLQLLFPLQLGVIDLTLREVIEILDF